MEKLLLLSIILFTVCTDTAKNSTQKQAQTLDQEVRSLKTIEEHRAYLEDIHAKDA